MNATKSAKGAAPTVPAPDCPCSLAPICSQYAELLTKLRGVKIWSPGPDPMDLCSPKPMDFKELWIRLCANLLIS